MPGYCLARRCVASPGLVPSFLVSLLVLFHVVFWSGTFGVPLRFGVVLAVLVGSTAASSVPRRGARASPTEEAGPPEAGRRWFLPAILAVGVVAGLRVFLNPLGGPDTPFRWNFLAIRIFEHATFAFYPPRSPGDFRTYFYPDGIPPMVPFAYWWLYASNGGVSRWVTGLFVGSQVAAIGLVTGGLADRLGPRRSGSVALAILASSPLAFWSVVMGQETGLIALSMAATTLAILDAGRRDGDGGMVLAGCAAAVGALSREYGWIAIPSGAVTAAWVGLPRRSIVLFVAVATALAAPWYVRNWALTGNPVYSNPTGGLFPANPVHVGLLRSYEEVAGVRSWDRARWISALRILLGSAPLQLVLGAFIGALSFRRHGYIAVGCGLVVAAWLYSVGQTSGGLAYSMRVLSPALVLSSALIASTMAGPGTSRRVLVLASCVVLVLCLRALPYDLTAPERPETVPISEWPRIALGTAPRRKGWAGEGAARLARFHRRILSDNAYLQAELSESGVDIVPVWSPEVRFLFDPGLGPEEQRRRLIALGIRAVTLPMATNARFLAKSSFYARDSERWTLGLRSVNPDVTLYLLQ